MIIPDGINATFFDFDQRMWSDRFPSQIPQSCVRSIQDRNVCRPRDLLSLSLYEVLCSASSRLHVCLQLFSSFMLYTICGPLSIMSWFPCCWGIASESRLTASHGKGGLCCFCSSPLTPTHSLIIKIYFVEVLFLVQSSKHIGTNCFV